MKLTCLLISILIAINAVIFSSCGEKNTQVKDEQISAEEAYFSSDTSSINSIKGGATISQVGASPSAIVLTGMPDHKLVTVYKNKHLPDPKTITDRFDSYSSDMDGDETEMWQHFMPGIDILYGYNLLNIAHYDISNGKLHFFFEKAALIKTLYYPSTLQDSLNNMPINRNYYLVSAYDEDNNKDTLINRLDLRNFYYIDASSYQKIRLIPRGYSTIQSQYDHQKDVMYVFARKDENKNGIAEKNEPVHIFWVDLKNPTSARRMY